MDEHNAEASAEQALAEQILIDSLKALLSTVLTESELRRLQLPEDESAYRLPLELRGQVQLAAELAGYRLTPSGSEGEPESAN